MAITANMTTSEGIAITGAYLVIKSAYVKKFDGDWTASGDDGETWTQGDASFKLIYDVSIYANATKRADRLEKNYKIKNDHVDHFKIDYDITSTDNPFKLAYADLKTNSNLSSVADA
tara:strand:- start:53 stop:403 length:351 start_codon:yes stop_codon:yes gene_type:complete